MDIHSILGASTQLIRPEYLNFTSGIFITLLVSFIFPLLFKSNKEQQLSLIFQAVKEIANGKLDTRIPQLEGNNLIQELAENINQMTISLEKRVTDLSNQKAEEKLKNLTIAQARLLQEIKNREEVLDEAAIVSEANQQGNIIFVNDKFCQISGYSREELIGRNHRIVNSDYHSEEFFKDLWSTIVDGRTWKGEIKNRRKDGSFYWVDSTIAPIFDER